MNIVEEIINIKNMLQKGGQSSPLDSWPVNSIFICAVGTNPSTLLGGGTWVEFGAGKVLVGQNISDDTFKTLGSTGGEKTHKLTGAESGLPKHSHSVTVSGAPGYNNTVAKGTTTSYEYTSYHSTKNLSGTAAAADQDQNASSAHNNLQPYVVVKMWKRTA